MRIVKHNQIFLRDSYQGISNRPDPDGEPDNGGEGGSGGDIGDEKQDPP